MNYIRKFYYLDLYEHNEKKENCGYVKMESIVNKSSFTFILKNIKYIDNCKLPVALIYKGKRENIGEIYVKNRRVNDRIIVEKGFEEKGMEQIEICIQEQYKICYTNPSISDTDMLKSAWKNNDIVIVDNLEQNTKVVEDSIEPEIPDIPNDKWEQLKKIYPTIHVFGEKIETLLIQPKDLVILTEEYQELANNSFLMHGYYNYRQLLLAKVQENGIEVYYIGVPGNYHEREKIVASMFGFEGFENGESGNMEAESSIYQGCFGYYMKKVEI